MSTVIVFLLNVLLGKVVFPAIPQLPVPALTTLMPLLPIPSFFMSTFPVSESNSSSSLNFFASFQQPLPDSELCNAPPVGQFGGQNLLVFLGQLIVVQPGGNQILLQFGNALLLQLGNALLHIVPVRFIDFSNRQRDDRVIK